MVTSTFAVCGRQFRVAKTTRPVEPRNDPLASPRRLSLVRMSPMPQIVVPSRPALAAELYFVHCLSVWSHHVVPTVDFLFNCCKSSLRCKLSELRQDKRSR
jgi:hypothetical protein